MLRFFPNLREEGEGALPLASAAATTAGQPSQGLLSSLLATLTRFSSPARAGSAVGTVFLPRAVQKLLGSYGGLVSNLAKELRGQRQQPQAPRRSALNMVVSEPHAVHVQRRTAKDDGDCDSCEGLPEDVSAAAVASMEKVYGDMGDVSGCGGRGKGWAGGEERPGVVVLRRQGGRGKSLG